jgi:hypothetical protein
MEELENLEFWCVVGNIKREIPFGSAGNEIKYGLKLFKAGAKVYIIGSYPGMCEDIIALGHHRKSGKYIHCVIRATAVENLRVKKIYSKSMLQFLKDFKPNGALLSTSKEAARELAKTIPLWANEM